MVSEKAKRRENLSRQGEELTRISRRMAAFYSAGYKNKPYYDGSYLYSSRHADVILQRSVLQSCTIEVLELLDTTEIVSGVCDIMTNHFERLCINCMKGKPEKDVDERADHSLF